MDTLIDLYDHLCTSEHLPLAQQKYFRYALHYLAASYDTTPDHLSLTPEIEATYRQRVKTFLMAQHKGHSTIRNTLHGIGQFLKASHEHQQTPRIEPVRPKLLRLQDAQKQGYKTSPYYTRRWLAESRYVKALEQFPLVIQEPLKRFRTLHRRHVRPTTIDLQMRRLRGVLSYLAMSPETRLSYLPQHSRDKLTRREHRDDFQTIIDQPVLQTIDDLFALPACESFMIWHSWRAHSWKEAETPQRPPSKPTTLATQSIASIYTAAKILGRSEASAIFYYSKELDRPRKIHDKRADYHRFSFEELERVARVIIDEARQIQPAVGVRKCQRPGANAAIRYQTGLILMMGWRCPLRVRNWCEMLLDTNLKKINGQWHVHFEGEELKIGSRGRERNIFEMPVAPEVVPYLEEYLATFRPYLDTTGRGQHVFPTRGDRSMIPRMLTARLKTHVYRHCQRQFYTHLFRTIFTSEMLSAGVDINSVAYGLGDQPATVLQSYNEMQAGKHQQSLLVAYSRALNGHGQVHGKGKTP